MDDILDLAEINLGDNQPTKEEAMADVNKRFYYLLQTFFRAASMKSKHNDVMVRLYFHSLMGAYLKEYTLIKPGGLTDLRIPIIWVQNCLQKDTSIIIKEKKGTKYVNISRTLEQLPNDFKVISHNFETGKDEVKNAKKIYSGKKKLLKITLENGSVVYATPEHKFFEEGGKEILVKDITTETKLAVRSPCRGIQWKEKVSDICKKRNKDNVFIKHMTESATNRWNNKEWVEKELENRKNQHNNYLQRGEILKEKFKGREWPVKDKEKVRKQYSNNMSGKNNISYGKVRRINNIYIDELNIKVKSSYEKKVALYLYNNKLPILYEPDTFELSYNNKFTTYTPDFKISDDLYIEVKGYLRPESIEKYKQFILSGKRLIFISYGHMIQNIKNNGFECYNINSDWRNFI